MEEASNYIVVSHAKRLNCHLSVAKRNLAGRLDVFVCVMISINDEMAATRVVGQSVACRCGAIAWTSVFI